MKENEWRNDAEYMSYVGNLLVKIMGVVRALEISKKTFNRIKLNLFWALIYNRKHHC